MTNATPTPWDTKPSAGNHQHLVLSESGKTIAVVYTNAADAELICCAVNGYGDAVRELYLALRQAVAAIEALPAQNEHTRQAVRRGKAALAAEVEA